MSKSHIKKIETISFVIPCYRSEHTINGVLDGIIKSLGNTLPLFNYEIICVVDNSPDNVFGVLSDRSKKDSCVKVLNLAKNFGQHSAMMAGLKYSSGDYVVFLDDDGQCPISSLMDLLKPLINCKADISIAKYNKKKQSLFRNFGSKFHGFIANILIDKPRDIEMSNFIAARKYIIDEIKKL